MAGSSAIALAPDPGRDDNTFAGRGQERDERLRHATPAELLSLVGDPSADLGHLNLVVEEAAERLMPAVHVSDSDRSSEPALRDEVGKDIALVVTIGSPAQR